MVFKPFERQAKAHRIAVIEQSVMQSWHVAACETPEQAGEFGIVALPWQWTNLSNERNRNRFGPNILIVQPLLTGWIHDAKEEKYRM